jgi:hypothetical protein
MPISDYASAIFSARKNRVTPRSFECARAFSIGISKANKIDSPEAMAGLMSRTFACWRKHEDCEKKEAPRCWAI